MSIYKKFMKKTLPAVVLFGASLIAGVGIYKGIESDRQLNQKPKFVETRLEESIRKEYLHVYEEAVDVFGEELKNFSSKMVPIDNDIDNNGTIDIIVLSDFGVSYFKNIGPGISGWEFLKQQKLVDIRPYNLGTHVIYDLRDINNDGLTDIIAISPDRKVLYFENKGMEK